jgi:hypothetical protein
MRLLPPDSYLRGLRFGCGRRTGGRRVEPRAVRQVRTRAAADADGAWNPESPIQASPTTRPVSLSRPACQRRCARGAGRAAPRRRATDGGRLHRRDRPASRSGGRTHIPTRQAGAAQAATLLLAALIGAYAVNVTAGLPWLSDHPEPVDLIGLATKAVEALGLVFAIRLSQRMGPSGSFTQTRRLNPRAATQQPGGA